MVPTEFRGDVALLGPDPPVGLWTCQCPCMCVRGGAQPPQHTALCFLGKEKVPCCQEKCCRCWDQGSILLTSSKET